MILTWYTGEPAILKSTIVISGAETLHVHMMVLPSVDWGLATTEASCRSTIFFFLDEWRNNQGFNLLIMMLHWVPPSLTSVSALTGDIGWCRGSISNNNNSKLPKQIKKEYSNSICKNKRGELSSMRKWQNMSTYEVTVFRVPNKKSFSWEFCFLFDN